ncbi:MAG: tyrosine-protein phosphatase [Bacilli bacterium]
MITITQITENKMIDIHSHILFDVDDGSKTLEQSINTLVQAQKIGVKVIVCTPHTKYGDVQRRLKVNKNFEILREIAKKYGIKLLLGNEIMLTSETSYLLSNKKIRTLNGSNYVLVEFKRNENRSFNELLEQIENIMDLGYRIILAHPELYANYQDIKLLKKLKNESIILQLDATSVIKNKGNSKIYKFAKKMLDENLVDIVASDYHDNEKRNYQSYFESYNFISKRYGEEKVKNLFYNYPLYILTNAFNKKD